MTYKNGVYLLPKQLDEEVAELHFSALGLVLTVFAQETDVVAFTNLVLVQLDLLRYRDESTADVVLICRASAETAR